MKKTTLNLAAALALATFAAGAAHAQSAQSNLTLYGNVDVAVDSVDVGRGVELVPGATALGLNTTGVFGDGRVTRVSPSGTSQTAFGIKGEENLGNGYKASFVLEGQLGLDDGKLGQDGRIFGRQAYVGLTTPAGEVRLGRQYAPIFYSTAFVTGERFGATDLFIEGAAQNNLMLRQDNQVSYWLKSGGFTGSVAFSPQAGSAKVISNERLNGVMGGLNTGGEYIGSKTGRSLGFFGNYAFTPAFNATLGYHQNDFDGATWKAVVPGAPIAITQVNSLDGFKALNLGAKYIFPSSGIMIDGAFTQAAYSLNGGEDIKTNFMVFGLRVPVNQWTFMAQASQIKFTNFTKGKDTGLMLGADYALSKRTTLYTRVGQLKDDAGNASNGLGLDNPHPLAPVGATLSTVGGPDVFATAMGLREIPVFANGGINPGGKTTYVGAGVRHSF